MEGYCPFCKKKLVAIENCALVACEWCARVYTVKKVYVVKKHMFEERYEELNND